MSYLAKKHGGKILVSGFGMPGATSVVETLLTGKHTLSTPDCATINYSRISRDINNTTIQILDLGCQTVFLDSFISQQAEFVFMQTSLLIFVIDVTNTQDLPHAKYYLDQEIQRLEQFSPTAEVFVFLNKIDLLDKKLLTEVTTSITNFLFPNDHESSSTASPRCFPVSCASGPEIFSAIDVIFNSLINCYFPGLSLQAFKQELWSEDEL